MGFGGHSAIVIIVVAFMPLWYAVVRCVLLGFCAVAVFIDSA